MVVDYVKPKKIILSERAEGKDFLLTENAFVSSVVCDNVCKLSPQGFILLDFDSEYSGGIRIVTNAVGGKKSVKIRIRFGESAMECMVDLGHKNACNDHSIRDEILSLTGLGVLEYGDTGFRFVRIDNIDDVDISLMQVLAVYKHSGKRVQGSFKSNDERLNNIWKAGVKTIYLNTGKYITDGIKRDKLVWVGDLHPEISSLMSILGADDAIKNSLDYIKGITKSDCWMNGIPSYSMWWIKNQYDFYVFSGDKEYLKEQIVYLKELIMFIGSYINKDGTDKIESKFIDWPSSDNPIAQDCGMHSMETIAFESAKNIFSLFGEDSFVDYCNDKLASLKNRVSLPNGNKQIASLSVFAGINDAKEINEQILSIEELSGLSTFMGYYVLIARKEAGDINGALNIIRKYYGAMLDLGSDTLWEDFDYDWIKNAAKIDTVLSDSEYDVHGDNGKYCYKGFRHSLCHGWASGLVAFLSRSVLGVTVKGGEKVVEISPNLGDLEWAEGVVPTPFGNLKVEHKRQGEKIITKYNQLNGVKIICN